MKRRSRGNDEITGDDYFNNFESEDNDARIGDKGLNSGIAGAAKTAANGGNAMDIASSGMIMSKDPRLMAAGAGMAVLSGGQKRKQSYYNAVADAENQRRTNLANALAANASMFGKMRL